MKQYHEMLNHILENGVKKSDRTGVGTTSVFGYQYRINLQEGFPLLTTKKVFWKGVVEELLWFLRGETNVKSLQEKGVHIWDEWCDKDGDLGPVYGAQWRNFGRNYARGRIHGIDQIAGLIHEIKTKPDSRRMMVAAWNPDDVEKVRLPWCHAFFQCNVANGKLSLHMYQRSADVFLGVPFNIASYALLTHMLAHVTGLKVGDFVHSFGDLHLYHNHVDQVQEQLSRTPRDLPVLELDNGVTGIDSFELHHIKLHGYDPYPAIKAEVAV